MKAVRFLLGPSCVLLIFTIFALPASALNIVLTNDDGFESSLIQATFEALKAAGHDVILSAPYLNQSGVSGSVGFMVPITPTTETSTGGLIGPGAPGVGPTTIADDQYYVNGPPVAAMLYGIDVAAAEKWGKTPDLVISGPNDGNNLGLMTVHSATVGAAVTALNRGIPAIAVSANMRLLQPTTPEQAQINAQLTVKLVEALIWKDSVALPAGIGLHVNFPRLKNNKSIDDYDFVSTNIGLASDYGMKFLPRLGDSAMAAQNLPEEVLDFPGVAVGIPYTFAGCPRDRDRKSEYNALRKGVVTISVIEGSNQAKRDGMVRGLLSRLRNPQDE